MNILPVALRLKGRRVLFVGGGRVAERKIRKMLGSGARIAIVSPALTPWLQGQAKRKNIAWAPRAFRSDDLRRVAFVVTCTDDARVNARVKRLADAKEILCTRADSGRDSSLTFGAALARGRIVIGVHSDRAGAKVVKRFRDALARRLA